MKKLLLASLAFTPILLLSSCAMTTATTYPGYTNDYVYSVGYYGYRPYWGTRYYSNYELENTYWGNYRNIYYYGDYGGAYPNAWYGYVSRW
ncbi:hypothetical protein [Legionella jordanis]|uniref:Lipoprotein n=1 Tax=Legionella jordanis TaxID=456 RepID=A0A0W0VC31_9GAMM|nr:hypothetical protein [Legionella jordanis]KTD17667.1 hypothetical protein Ljor_1973 [Legionella jordanis]RMX01539.1 hypothetical protein EAW55_10590 [Legionella jordanis]RMX21534.1 hypothetical protein EAS68_01870 [Legionella jordanis]VEH11404.1 Uncharacterised protein [Legionella jordanis]HAT8715071.1 hypothetical protein [Legionella jordanis]